MPSKSKKGGTNFIPNDNEAPKLYTGLLLNSKISTQPNIDPTYKEIGFIFKSNSVAKNAILEFKSDIYNVFGSTPTSDNNFFISPWILCIQELTNELNSYQEKEPNKILKISNVKFNFISIDTNSLTINAYGTLLCKDKENP